jgi:tetratricopeptide (TPR) repeat protein
MARLPLAGVVLRHIAKALSINPVRDGRDFVSGGSQSRFFKGELGADETLQKVLAAYAASLIDVGLLPAPSSLGGQWNDVVASSLAWHVETWNAIVGWMGSSAARVVRPDLAPRPYLRLAVVDLALRAGVTPIDEAESKLPRSEVPFWADGENAGVFLRRLQDKADLTREELTRLAIGPGQDNTVDRWLDGKVTPTKENIIVLGEVLGPRLGCSPDLLARRLRVHYALRRLGDTLAEHVGREQVVVLATAFERFRIRVRELVRDRPTKGLVDIMLLGSRAPSATSVLERLWNEERHVLWATELRAADGDWLARFQQAASVLSCIGNPETAKQFVARGLPAEWAERFEKNGGLIDLIQADMTRAPAALLKGRKFVGMEGDNAYKAASHEVQGAQALADWDLGKAVGHFRRAASLQPLNAHYQYRLGCSLWQLGVGERDPGLVRQGVETLWIAHKLDPEWDMPLVEVGIVHMNMGEDARALEHLEAAKATIRMTPWLAYHLGAARMRAGRFEDALAALDLAITDSPDDARALDDAAHCAFMIGDTRASDLAKRARDRGRCGSYDRWKAGGYPRNGSK